MHRDYIRNLTYYHSLIMGFLRSLYNADSSEMKPLDVGSQTVFIVHGHDNSLIVDVKNCVESISLSPVVLREQPNHGQTIYCIPPCDVGHAVTETEDEYRARQNVVYEHGLFQGYLGRKRIIVLRKGNTALPGDCSGIVYISVDNNHTWCDELKKNILAIDK